MFCDGGGGIACSIIWNGDGKCKEPNAAATLQKSRSVTLLKFSQQLTSIVKKIGVLKIQIHLWLLESKEQPEDEENKKQSQVSRLQRYNYDICLGEGVKKKRFCFWNLEIADPPTHHERFRTFRKINQFFLHK